MVKENLQNEEMQDLQQKQEKTEAPKDAVLIWDKEQGTVGAVSAYDEKTGDCHTVEPTPENYSGIMAIDQRTMLGKFVQAFLTRYKNPGRFRILRIPFAMIGKALDAIIRVSREGSREAERLIAGYELNREGRNAKVAERYAFEERELPLDELAEFGYTPQALRDAQSMGRLMKGYLTEPLPLYKEIEGKMQPIGEGSLQCIKGEDGIAHLHILTKLDEPEYENPSVKKLYTAKEIAQLKEQGYLSKTKKMTDFATGRECECYVSFHAPTNRILTLDASQVSIPLSVYGKELSPEEQAALKTGDSIRVENIRKKDGTRLSGTLRVNPAYRGVHLTADAEQKLVIGETFRGASLTPDQREQLANHQLVYVADMVARDGRRFSADVRFNHRGVPLFGRKAREYTMPKAETQNPTRRQAFRHVPGINQAASGSALKL